ncbi:RNA polymerase II subunit A C-terminal domain phosphatase [Phanerochaete sordida]|uniref:RNA polymerase II subunit A C-terminal domain phosphatase n=1 Tax=Phanerochaete sordida TaxID=48140 RepID=A0A9P3FZM3_9APHY|nr:RNA polymerase II subunit A C-terminal domain phosphatase [Phanerochaete sordida]
MSDPTELYLPPHLPYPIKVVAHEVHPAHTVQRGTRLLSYSFTHHSTEAGKETRFGTWDSSIEGTVDSWAFKPGDTVSQRRAREQAAIKILEPCKHGIQIGGLCCLCGKDMTDYDYTGFSDASRASIQMTHAANGPTVSLEEAQRIEKETADHLRKVRKLSLIVDLDQTIVHATVDPTVGEWIAEGEAWEARQADRKASTSDESDSPAVDDDEPNPNWEALKDVKKFRLGPEALADPRLRGVKRKAKDKSVESEGCMYYIKPRPGWKEFLEDMAEKYEMHVYTMGTRAYAEEVCAAIDPDGKIFGGRLLSRDESGSLTQKSLQRLFPCDQSMVVIIDDRADVWEWSPNLVKVVPFEFFVGIGDINSAFLPKQVPLTPVPQAPSAPGIPPAAPESPSDTAVTSIPNDVTEEELVEIEKTAILARNADALDAQMEERPLAKKQEELQEEEDQEEEEAEKKESESPEPTTNGDTKGDTPKPANGVEVEKPSTPHKHHHRKALLKNSDTELLRVQRILEEVHRQYYTAYDDRPKEEKEKHIKRKPSKHHVEPPSPYDVRLIIPSMRQTVLAGCHIMFSSVIPLDTRAETSETWRIAVMFGAKCYTELSPRITHLVAAKRGTAKVDAARRQGGVKIVWVNWFLDSINQWRRQDETPYLIDPEATAAVGPASPPSDPHQISSDPEPDADDWDYDRSAGVAPARNLELDGVDWDEINDEVEAAMNESDDDDDGDDDGASVKSGAKSGNVTEDEWTDESNSIISSASSTPSKRKRKRLRSVTPSEGAAGSDTDGLRSPLAKRKKLAAERTGASKLKVSISANDLADDEQPKTRSGTPTSPAANNDDDDDDMTTDSSDSDDGDGDEEDDFLARELGEDWG